MGFVYFILKIVVDNFCKCASKLKLAVAWGSLEAAAICASLPCFSFVVVPSFKSSWNWDEIVAGKVPAQARADRWWSLQTLCCWQRQVRARWSNHPVPTSPVAKKHSAEWWIRTGSTESVTNFSFFHKTLVLVAKTYHGKTGLIGDQFCSKWCHFSTTV